VIGLNLTTGDLTAPELMAPELMVLALAVSVGVAVLGGMAAALIARTVRDAGLREKAWSLALWAPILPLLATAVLLALPAPVRTVTLAPASPVVMSASTTAPILIQAPPPPPVFTIDGPLIAWSLLGLALVLSLARLSALGVRAMRLRRLTAQAAPPSAALSARVAVAAEAVGLAPPALRVSDTAPEALLAGLFSPLLILPAALAATPDTAGARAVIAHEIAHLKRRDHHALWAEEALMVLMAFNPVTALLRHRRAAAREEACDALALRDASPGDRRAYAQSLIEALRSRAGLPPETLPLAALTFTAQRSFAMNRLKAVLNPAPAAGRRARALALFAGTAVLALAGAASWAVAAQRAPDTVYPEAAEDDRGPVLDEADGQPVTLMDAAWLNAALDPVYRGAWPTACGYGADADGKVFIQTGEGCGTGRGANPVIQTLAGIDPSLSPRAAFLAVKAACDAKRPVPVAYVQNGERKTVEVACSAPAAAPATQKAFEVALNWNGVTLSPGDTLEVRLVKQDGDNTHRRSLAFALTGQSRLPASVTARVGQEFFGDAASPEMTATLYDRNGNPKARTDTAQPRRPMLVSANAAEAFAVLTPVAQTSGQQASGQQGLGQPITGPDMPRLDPNSPERIAGLAAARAKYDGYTAAQYKAACASSDTMDNAFCAGVLFGLLPEKNETTNTICAPTQSDGDFDTTRIAREAGRTVAGISVSSTMSMADVARTALQTAYPCPTGQAYLIDGKPAPNGMPG
jgi:beta-lactamase regulating signal transducer with metallopeptidase domain